MVENVQQTTIEPTLNTVIAPEAVVHTDEDAIYNVLEAWGYEHKTVVYHTAGRICL
ncbi:MAG: transposase [Nodosilinea sp.]